MSLSVCVVVAANLLTEGYKLGFIFAGFQVGLQRSSPSQKKNNHAHNTTKNNVEWAVNLKMMFLDFGKNFKYLERTHACTGKHSNVMQEPWLGFEPSTFWQPCYQLSHHTDHVLHPDLKGTSEVLSPSSQPPLCSHSFLESPLFLSLILSSLGVFFWGGEAAGLVREMPHVKLKLCEEQGLWPWGLMLSVCSQNVVLMLFHITPWCLLQCVIMFLQKSGNWRTIKRQLKLSLDASSLITHEWWTLRGLRHRKHTFLFCLPVYCP